MFHHIDKKHSSLKRLSTTVKLLISLHAPLVLEEYTPSSSPAPTMQEPECLSCTGRRGEWNALVLGDPGDLLEPQGQKMR